MSARSLVRLLLPVSSCAVMLLAGCAMQSTGALTGATLQGGIHGGQQPIAGAQVYLFAAGTGGYGGKGIAASSSNASVSLLTSDVLTNNPGRSGKNGDNYYVLTDSNGGFTITGDYSCTAGQQVYIYAVGGNPGAGVNSAAGLIAAVGDCSTLTPSTYIFANEVSTIAAAYALAGFATDATHISSSNTALAKTGMANAFRNVANLATLRTGAAVDQFGTTAAPTVNYLANVIAACINSNGTSSAGCAGLLPVATSTGVSGGTQATDTATAALYIAQNPWANVHALYTLPPAGSPFVSTMTEPADWTLALHFSGSTLGSAAAIAVDAGGNVWITNRNAALISKFDSMGSLLSGSSGYTASGMSSVVSLAIDPSGNAWAANLVSPGQVTKFASSGTYLASYNDSWTSADQGLAFDKSGNLWTTSSSGLVRFNGSTTNSPASTGDTLLGVALDGSSNLWTMNSAYFGALYEFAPPSTSLGAATIAKTNSDGGIGFSSQIAIDSTGNIWVSNANRSSYSEFTSANVAVSPSAGFTGMSQASSIAADSAGRVWMTAGISATSSYINQMDATGAVVHATNNAVGRGVIAVDGSGNLWVASGSDLEELIGVSAPTVTPLVGNLIAPYTHPASAP